MGKEKSSIRNSIGDLLTNFGFLLRDIPIDQKNKRAREVAEMELRALSSLLYLGAAYQANQVQPQPPEEASKRRMIETLSLITENLETLKQGITNDSK